MLEESYEDCILKEVPKAKTDGAAQMITIACKDQHAIWKKPECVN